MNEAQARKNVAAATQARKEAERKLGDVHRLVNGAVEAEKAAESILLDIIANEPTEDKVIDMSHFIGSNLIMEFSFADELPELGYLHSIIPESIEFPYSYISEYRGVYECCTPKFNHDYASITGWDKPPIPEGYVLRYKKFKNDFVIYYKSDYSKLDWSRVAMFRIVAIKDGFKHE